jgi:hypothetical protein
LKQGFERPGLFLDGLPDAPQFFLGKRGFHRRIKLGNGRRKIAFGHELDELRPAKREVAGGRFRRKSRIMSESQQNQRQKDRRQTADAAPKPVTRTILRMNGHEITSF